MKPYALSGKVPLHAPVTTLAYGLLGVIPLAAIYVLVTRYNPFVYFSFIATLLYGASVGAVAGLAAKSSKARARWFYAVAGMVFGVLGLWLQWIFWAWLVYDPGSETAVALLTGGPSDWIGFLDHTAHSLHVTFGSLRQSARAELTPGNLYAVWSIEAVLIFGASSLVGALGSSEEAFNERTERWAELQAEGHLTHPELDKAAMADLIQREGVAGLMALGAHTAVPTAESPVKSLHVKAYGDPSDADFCLVAVDAVTHSLKKNGKVKTEPGTLTPLSLIGRPDHEALLACLRAAVPEAPPAQVA